MDLFWYAFQVPRAGKPNLFNSSAKAGLGNQNYWFPWLKVDWEPNWPIPRLGLGWESNFIDVLGWGWAGKPKLLISWARAFGKPQWLNPWWAGVGLGKAHYSTFIDVLGLGWAGKAKLLISWARAGLLRLKSPIVSFNSEPLVLQICFTVCGEPLENICFY